MTDTAKAIVHDHAPSPPCARTWSIPARGRDFIAAGTGRWRNCDAVGSTWGRC